MYKIGLKYDAKFCCFIAVMEERYVTLEYESVTVAYRGGCSNPPPPKFWRYRWSPRSHEQEELASRFTLV